MKLIINIPDEAYELLKNKSKLDNIAESIIANGTPISTEGDLISRTKLLISVLAMIGHNNEIVTQDKVLGWVQGVDNCRELIENAPTVEPFEPDYVGAERLKARQRGYEEGYHNGMEIGKTLNPKIKQGEWIDYDNTFYKCPDCGYLLEKCCPQCQNKVILPKGGEE